MITVEPTGRNADRINQEDVVTSLAQILRDPDVVGQSMANLTSQMPDKELVIVMPPDKKGQDSVVIGQTRIIDGVIVHSNRHFQTRARQVIKQAGGPTRRNSVSFWDMQDSRPA